MNKDMIFIDKEMKKKRETMKKGWFLVRETKRGRRRRRE